MFSEVELHSRYEILIEEYYKTINIEARTMLSMAKTQIMPAVINYMTQVAQNVSIMTSLEKFNIDAQSEMLTELNTLLNSLKRAIDELEIVHKETIQIEEGLEKAQAFRNNVLPKMEALREVADKSGQFLLIVNYSSEFNTNKKVSFHVETYLFLYKTL